MKYILAVMINVLLKVYTPCIRQWLNHRCVTCAITTSEPGFDWIASMGQQQRRRIYK